MNRRIIKVLVLATFVMAFASCKKTKSEWSNFFGYTSADVAGTYVFSEYDKAFEGFTEGSYCILCRDAQIVVTATSESAIKFAIDCPDHNYSKVFMGKAPLNSNDFLIDIKGNKQWQSSSNFIQNRLHSRVYKNAENKIRLAGSGVKDAYQIKEQYIYDDSHFIIDTLYDTILTSSTNYFFDVIKE